MKIASIVKLLSYLIAIISVIPLIIYIYPVYTALFIVSLLTSLKYELEKRLWLNIFGILSILFTLRHLSIDNLIIPGLEAVIILFSIKFLEKKKYRDYMQIYTLAIFSLAGYSLLSINMIFLLYLGIILLLISIAAVFLTYFDANENMIIDKESFLQISYKSSYIFILAIPLAIAIFIILPRVEYPFFDFLNNEKTTLTGFSDKVSLGDVSEIQQDNSVIFRAKMRKVPDNFLYWRGVVLDKFNGKIWYKSTLNNKPHPKFTSSSQSVKQTIYLEPYYGKYLFTLDKPLKIVLKKISIDKNLTVKYFENIYRRIRYNVYSVPAKYIVEQHINKGHFLQLPENISKGLLTFANSLHDKYNIKTIKNIKNYFLSNNFKYTLTKLPLTDKPIENFLFKTKKGNCEYFASSFALLLRLNGIPSRIVAGYKGGEYSNLGGYYIVRQKDAHVWTEAYINKRWYRIDPITFTVSPKVISKKILTTNTSKYNIKLIIDLINYYYIVFFINYNFDKQIKIIKTVANLKLNKIFLKKLFVKFFIFAVLSVFMVFIIKILLNFTNSTDYHRILKRFLKKLEKKGYKKDRTETLHNLLEKITVNDLKIKAEKFVNLFEEIYFKDKKFTKNEIDKLKEILKEIDQSV